MHRQRVICECEVGEEIILVRHRSNEYDENAVCCFRTFGQDIGYNPARAAEDVATDLDRGRAVLARIVQIERFTSTGGNNLLGVNLELTP